MWAGHLWDVLTVSTLDLVQGRQPSAVLADRLPRYHCHCRRRLAAQARNIVSRCKNFERL